MHLLWSDRDNRRHGATVELDIKGENERTLNIYVNGVCVAYVPCSDTTRAVAESIGKLVR